MGGRRILITGSAGLVGRAMRLELNAQGWSTAPYDIADDPRLDILHTDSLSTHCAQADGIIHLAAVSRVAHGEADPRRCWQVNVVGTGNVLAAARAAPTRPWVILASSREVYGEPDRLPVREGDPVRPLNVYGRSKAAAEAAAWAAQAEGVTVAVVRFASVYGDVHDHADRVVPAFCRAAAAGAPMNVQGSDYTFDFTHARDVAMGVRRLAERLHEGTGAGRVIHLASGRGTTLGELAALANAAGGFRSEVRLAVNEPHNVSRFVGCPDRAREVLGWTAETAIEEGVRGLVGEFAQIESGRPS